MPAMIHEHDWLCDINGQSHATINAVATLPGGLQLSEIRRNTARIKLREIRVGSAESARPSRAIAGED